MRLRSGGACSWLDGVSDWLSSRFFSYRRVWLSLATGNSISATFARARVARSSASNRICSKSECMTFVQLTMRPPGHVILSAAKNRSERPFTEFILSEVEGFRVTPLGCLSFEVWLGGFYLSIYRTSGAEFIEAGWSPYRNETDGDIF
jgi:hypothetical protein